MQHANIRLVGEEDGEGGQGRKRRCLPYEVRSPWVRDMAERDVPIQGGIYGLSATILFWASDSVLHRWIIACANNLHWAAYWPYAYLQLRKESLVSPILSIRILNLSPRFLFNNDLSAAMMKPIPYAPSARAGISLLSRFHTRVATLLFSHHVGGASYYATTSSSANSNPRVSPSSSGPHAKRRAVTPFNDTGHISWSALSRTEKVGRVAQQTFNFGVIVVGAVLTGAIGYSLFVNVFSPNSATAHFHRAFDRVCADHRCTAALGPADELAARGDQSSLGWRKSRPVR